MINSISSNALETTTSFKHSGISTSETYVWQIDGVSAGLRLYNLGNGKYLSAKNTGEISLSGASGAAKWLFNAQADGTVLIQDNVNSKRVMERSDNTYKTSAVTGMNLSHGIAAYLLVEEAENDPVLSFNLSMKSASLGTPFTSPELSVATGFDGTVTYSSSNERVATVDPSTGVVTLVAPGMAKIIASSAATANYQADETFYSLRVYDGDGTAEHPYSIGSLYSGDATLAAGNYFTGYVVGSLKSSSAMATTSTCNDAIVIADDPDESAIHMVLPIDLSTSLESYYGLNSHPDMLGCRVIVSGSKTSLYGLTCMDATSLSATRDVTICPRLFCRSQRRESGAELDNGRYSACQSGDDTLLCHTGNIRRAGNYGNWHVQQYRTGDFRWLVGDGEQPLCAGQSQWHGGLLPMDQ